MTRRTLATILATLAMTAVAAPAAAATTGNLEGAYGNPAIVPGGWACDPAHPTEALLVDIYVDGPFGQGVYVGQTRANLPRADLARVCGGNANHAFSFTMPPALADGGHHTIFAYAHDVGSLTPRLLPGHGYVGPSPDYRALGAWVHYPITVAAYYYPNYRQKFKYGQPPYTDWSILHGNFSRFPGHQPNTHAAPGWDDTDETTPSVFAKKIKAAKDHHVSVFLFDWYWNDKISDPGVRSKPYLEEALTQGFLRAPNANAVRFALTWANDPLTGASGAISQSTWTSDIIPRVVALMQRQNYWKPGGLPYFSIINPTEFASSWGNVENLATWQIAGEKLNELRRAARNAGLQGVHVNVIDHGMLDASNVAGKLARLGADSVTSYNWADHDENLLTRRNCTDPGYQSISYAEHFDAYNRDYLGGRAGVDFARWTNARFGGIPYLPNVSQGWDASYRLFDANGVPRPLECRHVPDASRYVAYPDMPVVTGNTANLFREYLAGYRRSLDRAGLQAKFRFMTINAWNEWTEGSHLEPDDRTGPDGGFAYLRAILEAGL